LNYPDAVAGEPSCPQARQSELRAGCGGAHLGHDRAAGPARHRTCCCAGASRRTAPWRLSAAKEGGRWLGGFDRQILRAPVRSVFSSQRLRAVTAKERSEDLEYLTTLIEEGKSHQRSIGPSHCVRRPRPSGTWRKVIRAARSSSRSNDHRRANGRGPIRRRADRIRRPNAASASSSNSAPSPPVTTSANRSTRASPMSPRSGSGSGAAVP
jgi:hypothetical protein